MHAAPPECFKGYISALELDFPGKLNAMPHVGREDRPAALTPSDIKQLKDQREKKKSIVYVLLFGNKCRPSIYILFQ